MAVITVFDCALADAERVGAEVHLADEYGIHERTKWG
jgi:hypothetical protein